MSSKGENNGPFSTILATRAESKKAFIILIVDTYFELFKKVSFPGAIKSIETELKILITEEEKKSLRYRYYNINKRGKSSASIALLGHSEIKNEGENINEKVDNSQIKKQETMEEKLNKLRSTLTDDLDKNIREEGPLFK